MKSESIYDSIDILLYTVRNCKLVVMYTVNTLNSGSELNIGYGPQSGPSLYSEAKGRDAAHQLIIGPKPAK